MISKKLLRLRDWVVAWTFAGTKGARYFFAESDARDHLDSLTRKSPVVLERYPDNQVERYYGFYEGKDCAIEIRRLQAQDALQRYPRIVAHMICHSLGYCTPSLAGTLVLAAARNHPHYCEWIYSCYKSDPWPALYAAVASRHGHKGYMADIRKARSIVQHSKAGGPDPLLASWF